MWELIMIYTGWALNGLVIFLWAAWSELRAGTPTGDRDWIHYLQ